MARFQGNIHEGSDRAGRMLLFLVFVAALLLVLWWQADPASFGVFWDNVTRPLPGGKT